MDFQFYLNLESFFFINKYIQQTQYYTHTEYLKGKNKHKQG